MVNNFEPCRVADVGGGKGLLSHMLNESGWDAEVIDPLYQQLPHKYKTLDKKRVKLQDRESVTRQTRKFTPEIVKEFDWIVGLHLHGANMAIIKACREYGKDFLLLPCCVIDEPIEKRPGVNWRESLVEYAQGFGMEVKKVQFNFKGKNIGIYTDKNLRLKSDPDLEINRQVLILGSDYNERFL